MAIQDFSVVSPKTLSTLFENIGDWSAQPPITGMTYGGGEGGSFTVLWSNGLQASAVPEEVLDEIITATDESKLLIGKTVRVGTSSSANYESVVTAVYNRSGDQVALLKSVATGAYREALVDQLVVVPGH